MLINPSVKFSQRVLMSADYLNCSKNILNYHLDCIYRQFIVEQGIDRCIQEIAEYLKKHDILQPKDKAIQFVNWRNSIKMSEFDKININTYVDNPPKEVIERDNYINNWYKTHTKEIWRFGHLIEKYVNGSPFSKIN